MTNASFFRPASIRCAPRHVFPTRFLSSTTPAPTTRLQWQLPLKVSVSAITDHILMKRDLPVIPGAEITQNHIRSKRNSHIVALNIREFISADQPAEDILREVRRQGVLSIACHPHHRTTRRFEIRTCFLWDHRKRLAELVDVWEAANRDDLFSVTSLKHYPYVANSDFHKAKHLYSWKTRLRCEKDWDSIAHTLRAKSTWH